MVSPPSFIFPPTFPRRHRTVWTYKSHRSCGLPFNTYEERGAIFLKSYIQCLKWTRKYHPASPSFLQSRARCFPPPGMLSPTATPAPTGMTPTPASSTVSQQFPCNFQSMGPGDGAEEQGVGQRGCGHRSASPCPDPSAPLSLRAALGCHIPSAMHGENPTQRCQETRSKPTNEAFYTIFKQGAPHKGETERTAVGLETLEGNMKGQRPSPTSPQCQRSRRHLHDKEKPVSIWAGPKGGLPTAFEVGSGASTGGGLQGTDTSTHPPRRGQEFSRDKTPGSGTGYRDKGRGIRQRNRGWDMGTGDRAREQYGCPVPDTGAVHTLCAVQHPEHPHTHCMWHRPQHTAPCMHSEHSVLPVCARRFCAVSAVHMHCLQHPAHTAQHCANRSTPPP